MQGICESALVPACRAALYACRREDVSSLARVLRAVATHEGPGVDKVARTLMDSLKEDLSRLMQTSLEAVDADAETATRIVALLGNKVGRARAWVGRC